MSADRLRTWCATRISYPASEVAALLAQRDRLADCLEEACDWLDADLATNPTPIVEMADRELIARWRAEL